MTKSEWDNLTKRNYGGRMERDVREGYYDDRLRDDHLQRQRRAAPDRLRERAEYVRRTGLATFERASRHRASASLARKYGKTILSPRGWLRA